jgi:transcription elongation factor GreA
MVTTSKNGLGPEARRQLEAELAKLRTRREEANPRPGESGRGGDAADQADLLERAETASWLDRRIAEVVAMLEHGVPSNSSILPDGTSVTIRFADGDEDTLHVVAVPGDDADNSVLTSDSPLGLALVGAKAGDEVSYRTPGGRTTATVVTITPPA